MRSVMREEACVTDLRLDEWSAGELEPEAAAEVHAHVTSCDRCWTRHEVFEHVRTSFLEQAPEFQAPTPTPTPTPIPTPIPSLPRLEVVRGDPAPLPPSRRRLQIAAALSSVALAAAAVLLIATDPESEPLTGVRPKGGAHIDFFVKRGKHVERGVRGRALRAGDELRFTYSTTEDSHLAIFDLDAHSASTFFPNAQHAERVAAGQDVALDFSVELDGTPGDEWVHALFCREPFEVEPVRAALADKRGLSIPKGCQLDVISIAKVRSP